MSAKSPSCSLGFGLRSFETALCWQAVLMSATYDHCHAPPLAWKKPPNPDPSVNEVKDPGGTVGTVVVGACVE